MKLKYYLNQYGNVLMRRLVGLSVAMIVVAAAVHPVSDGKTGSSPDLHLTALHDSFPAFGFSNGSTMVGLSDADLNREMDAAVSVGAKQMRIEVSWQLVEPSPGVYNWGPVDRVMVAAYVRGLKIVGLITYAPPWAQDPAAFGNTFGRPANPDTFGMFAATVANRYSVGANTWEIWNEQNFWYNFSPDWSANAYLPTLNAAYRWIKYVQPSATVLVGGLGNTADWMGGTSPASYVGELYARGGKGSFDGIAMHPYTTPELPPNNGYWQQIAAVRNIMVANGDATKKIWITEFGATTYAGGPVDQTKQSQILVAGLVEAGKLDYIGGFLIHTLRDTGNDPAGAEDNFGLLKRDFTPKLAFSTLKS